MNKRPLPWLGGYVWVRFQTADRLRVVNEFLRGHAEPFEVPPPSWPRFAAVILQEFGSEPTRRSGLSAFEQLIAKELPRILRFGRLLGNGAQWRRLGPSQIGGTQPMEPVEKSERRSAVLLVVRGDADEESVIVRIDPLLVMHNRVHARPDSGGTREPKNGLDLLQGVTRNACA